jgi:hypothetical protein
MQYRLRRHEGEYRGVFDQGIPRFNPDGSFEGYIGSGTDVSEQKQAQEALNVVNQKLIEAQEQERSQLARELHHDINQRIALHALDLEQIKTDLPSSQAKLRIADGCVSVGTRLQHSGFVAPSASFEARIPRFRSGSQRLLRRTGRP